VSVHLLKNSVPDLRTVMSFVAEEHPTATRGVVIVFDEQGGMHMQFACSQQEMALAAVRLTYLAGAGGK
jgi:hypothetical protein